MSDEERREEAAPEAIEDLEAPADAQSDVGGGLCADPTEVCAAPSCVDTVKRCMRLSLQMVVYEK
jgi:hypothetical protein